MTMVGVLVVSLTFEIYVYCMGVYYKRLADEEDGEYGSIFTK